MIFANPAFSTSSILPTMFAVIVGLAVLAALGLTLVTVATDFVGARAPATNRLSQRRKR